MRLLFLLVFPIALFLAGCNSPGCLVEQKVVSTSADFVASTLECANVSAVKADLTKVVDSLAPGLCKKNDAPQGPLADVVCPVVANAVVDYVVLNGVPSEWGCKSSNIRLLAKDKLIALCKKLPVVEN